MNNANHQRSLNSNMDMLRCILATQTDWLNAREIESRCRMARTTQFGRGKVSSQRVDEALRHLEERGEVIQTYIESVPVWRRTVRLQK